MKYRELSADQKNKARKAWNNLEMSIDTHVPLLEWGNDEGHQDFERGYAAAKGWLDA